VNNGYGGHHEATREDGDDVTMVFAVGRGSVAKVIRFGLTSSAHTSAIGYSVPGMEKHVIAQQNYFGRAAHGVVHWGEGLVQHSHTTGRAPGGTWDARGMPEAMTEGLAKSSIREGEGTGEWEGVEPDGGGATCAAMKPSLSSIVGGEGDQEHVKGTMSNGARDDPLSSREDAADDIN
jgi:hypothetical protein